MISADSCLGSASPEVVILARFSFVKMVWIPSQTRVSKLGRYVICGSWGKKGDGQECGQGEVC
jgi:hypothetical protein